METEPTFYTELANAIPIIIGGLLAIIGGIMGQVLTHRLSARRERNELLNTRIEAIVKALYAHSRWIEEKFDTMVFRIEDHNSPSPLDEAIMLKSLYFPELHQEIVDVMAAQTPLVNFIWEQRIARKKDDAAWLQTFNRSPYNEAYKAHLSALSAVTRKCRAIVESRLEK